MDNLVLNSKIKVKLKLTVIIPCYNVASYLQSLFKLCLSHDYSFLLCDDASTDEPDYTSLEELPNVTLFRNKKNLGYLKTFNFLLSKANTPLIALMDADDWCDNDRFEKQIQFLKNNSEYSIVGCSIAMTDPKGIIYRVIDFPETHNAFVSRVSSNGIPMIQGSIMFKREVYEKIGGYRLWFNRRGAEDADWILRALEHFKIANINSCLYYYRQHSQSVTYHNPDSKGINKYRMYSTQVAYYLYKQRLSGEKDFLEINKLDEIDKWIDKLQMNQKDNVSSVYIANKLVQEFNCMSKMKFIKRLLSHCRQYFLKPPFYLAFIKLIKMVLVKNFYYRFRFSLK